MSQWVISLYTMSNEWTTVNSLMLKMLGKQSWLNGVDGLRKQRKTSIRVIQAIMCSCYITPEASRIAVFSNGTCIRLNGWIPVGGQVDPNSIVGDSIVWKNAQKNDTKNKTSETMVEIRIGHLLEMCQSVTP